MTILYLTFYFDPDLCPGSFRSTSLVNELSSQLTPNDAIHVITTQPNRYQSYQPAAAAHEEWNHGGCPIIVQRVAIPTHKSGLLDQTIAFWVYFWAAHRLTRHQSYDLVVASSSRLFTAFLGVRLARRQHTRLFLDIRDLFREAIMGVINWPIIPNILGVILRFIERYTFGYAQHINLVSEGFASYFAPFGQATYSYFTNGIDPLFLTIPATQSSQPSPRPSPKIILYAGNIGEGQGLHTIIPQAAQQLGDGYQFRIIGDGSARHKLEAALRANRVTNVELCPPMPRWALVTEYQNAHYLFLHLNTLAVCQRVLPSKLFEYGATDKPILAGVTGYAATFIQEHLPNSLIFTPSDVGGFVQQLRKKPYYTQPRAEFKQRFQRRTINQQLAWRILEVNAKKTKSHY